MPSRALYAGRTVDLALLAAYSFAILRWPPRFEGPGALLSVAALPVSFIGNLLSFWRCFSPARRGLAVAGVVHSLVVALVILGLWILTFIELSQAHCCALA